MINKYNEKGVFALVHKEIYWFNGKQFIYWCDKPVVCKYVFEQRGNLYISDGYGTIFIYKNKEFQIAKLKNTHPIKTYSYFYGENCIKTNFNNIECFFETYEWQGHQYNFRKWDKINGYQILATKTQYCGYIMYCYKNYIYYFSNYKNQKFNMITNEWSNFSNDQLFYPNEFPMVYALNNKFYRINNNVTSIEIYDPEKDEWKVLVIGDGTIGRKRKNDTIAM